MVDYKYSDLFLHDSKHRQLRIEFDSGAITNEYIHSEKFELTESICSENQLRFGCCEASLIKFRISNIFTPLNGKWLTVTETLDGNTDAPFLFGKYKVYSDKPTADRTFRDVIAYDSMYDILNADVADWYNTILPNADSKVTLKEFRDSFLSHFEIEQEEVTLINDSMTVEKTIEPSELSGKNVITAICEINGCFGHIGRDGKFRYVYLEQSIDGLYPGHDLYPSDNLFPKDDGATKIEKSHYISCRYEDFVTSFISKVQIRQEENDIGAISGNGDNCYIIQDNFLVYGKGEDELQAVADNLFEVISKVSYRPFEVECIGNPCLEPGDYVRLSTKHEIVRSYILKRTLKGIQSLKDNYESEGARKYSANGNSIRQSIVQLKGKTNELVRTVEETRLTITDVEKKLQSQITVNTNGISTKVSRDSIVSEINQSAEKITIKANKIDLQGLVEAEEFTAKYASVNELNAQKSRINSIEANYISASAVAANYATLSNLTAVDAKVSGKLEASQFTAENISAMNITVKSANVTGGFSASKITSGKIAADRFDASTIASIFTSSNNITVGALNAQSVITSSINVSVGASILGRSVSWKTVTISGTTITYLG